jgi:hypothetical protein
MAALLQVTYASRSNFPPNTSGGIEPELARILLVSRRNNPRRGLVGALYYGDGCFFQCLEGPQQAIEALLKTLATDPRHSDLKILSRRDISRRNFSAWAMKYVPLEDSVKRLLRTHQLDSFDPYRFDASMIDGMVRLLQTASDPELKAADSSASPDLRDAEQDMRKVTRLAWVAVGLAATSLVVSLLALVLG